MCCTYTLEEIITHGCLAISYTVFVAVGETLQPYKNVVEPKGAHPALDLDSWSGLMPTTFGANGYKDNQRI
jgi:hypothetical protein